jgi:hypothetical protein
MRLPEQARPRSPGPCVDPNLICHQVPSKTNTWNRLTSNAVCGQINARKFHSRIVKASIVLVEWKCSAAGIFFFRQDREKWFRLDSLRGLSWPASCSRLPRRRPMVPHGFSAPFRRPTRSLARKYRYCTRVLKRRCWTIPLRFDNHRLLDGYAVLRCST